MISKLHFEFRDFVLQCNGVEWADYCLLNDCDEMNDHPNISLKQGVLSLAYNSYNDKIHGCYRFTHDVYTESMTG